ncbi:MAG: lipoyl(octanoyl) transferase [Candidatus Deianiraeaceae bacterium]|jgi:lipoyl(octanoyl) transferase
MEFKISDKPIDYKVALQEMEERHIDVLNEIKPEMVWLLEHYDTYTAGISAKDEDLINPQSVPVVQTKRGGKFTYHGSGQLVSYFVCNLQRRAGEIPDVRCFVDCLEDIIINTLSKFGIKGEKRKDRIGVWVQNACGEEKIAAIGVKFSKGITMHGFAINIKTDLDKFKGIVPCGISEFGVCSMQSIGINANVDDVRDEVVKQIKIADEQNFYQKKCKNF